MTDHPEVELEGVGGEALERAAISTETAPATPTRVIGRPFQPGQSGNPSGRPKGSAEARELAREHTPEAIKTLAELMINGKPRDRIEAAKALLDRAWGKPTVEITGPDGDPLWTGVVVLPPESDE